MRFVFNEYMTMTLTDCDGDGGGVPALGRGDKLMLPLWPRMLGVGKHENFIFPLSTTWS